MKLGLVALTLGHVFIFEKGGQDQTKFEHNGNNYGQSCSLIPIIQTTSKTSLSLMSHQFQETKAHPLDTPQQKNQRKMFRQQASLPARPSQP
jgi:hypothetical protein